MQVFQGFLASTILLGILLVLLIYANIVLLVYHPPTTRRPFDIALIHAPMRAFLILPLGVLFPYSLLYVPSVYLVETLQLIAVTYQYYSRLDVVSRRTATL